MGQIKHNTENRKGKHLTYENRIKIETLYQEGLTPLDIGERLIKSRRTIERELARGMVELLNSDLTMRKEYSAVVGQNRHDEKATAKGPALKIGNDHKLVEYIERSIKSGYSPYATLQNIENDDALNFNTRISVKTLYNYIESGLFMNISNKDLIVKKRGKKRDYHQIRTAITNTKGTSIADRPIDIDSREEIGHWEMDTVVGKQGTKTTLLVMSERMTRQELIFKINSKSQSEVIRMINRLQRKYGKEFSTIFKSITTDNGCEFLDFEGIEKSIFGKKSRTKMYFAHPYSSWERGTNENINKMIRRFIPKGVDISAFTNKELQRIQNWINNYPRKILGGKSANMLLKNYMTA
jgi:IS30 family transposase